MMLKKKKYPKTVVGKESCTGTIDHLADKKLAILSKLNTLYIVLWLHSYDGAIAHNYSSSCACGLGPPLTSTNTLFYFTLGVDVVDEWI